MKGLLKISKVSGNFLQTCKVTVLLMTCCVFAVVLFSVYDNKEVKVRMSKPERLGYREYKGIEISIKWKELDGYRFYNEYTCRYTKCIVKRGRVFRGEREVNAIEIFPPYLCTAMTTTAISSSNSTLRSPSTPDLSALSLNDSAELEAMLKRKTDRIQHLEKGTKTDAVLHEIAALEREVVELRDRITKVIIYLDCYNKYFMHILTYGAQGKAKAGEKRAAPTNQPEEQPARKVMREDPMEVGGMREEMRQRMVARVRREDPDAISFKFCAEKNFAEKGGIDGLMARLFAEGVGFGSKPVHRLKGDSIHNPQAYYISVRKNDLGNLRNVVTDLIDDFGYMPRVEDIRTILGDPITVKVSCEGNGSSGIYDCLQCLFKVMPALSRDSVSPKRMLEWFTSRGVALVAVTHSAPDVNGLVCILYLLARILPYRVFPILFLTEDSFLFTRGVSLGCTQFAAFVFVLCARGLLQAGGYHFGNGGRGEGVDCGVRDRSGYDEWRDLIHVAALGGSGGDGYGGYSFLGSPEKFRWRCDHGSDLDFGGRRKGDQRDHGKGMDGEGEKSRVGDYPQGRPEEEVPKGIVILHCNTSFASYFIALGTGGNCLFYFYLNMSGKQREFDKEFNVGLRKHILEAARNACELIIKRRDELVDIRDKLNSEIEALDSVYAKCSEIDNVLTWVCVYIICKCVADIVCSILKVLCRMQVTGNRNNIEKIIKCIYE